MYFEVDTTGDGKIDTVYKDTTGDGQYNVVLQDTTGDGQFDTCKKDTTGDGRSRAACRTRVLFQKFINIGFGCEIIVFVIYSCMQVDLLILVDMSSLGINEV